MEMHRPLGLAGGAGGKADQTDIVDRGVGCGELVGRVSEHRGKFPCAEIQHWARHHRAGRNHIVGQAMIADDQRDLSLFHRID